MKGLFDLFKKEEINSLKARIAELEEENKTLSLQLGKRDEKAKKTVATKQEVDRELNEKRQRISSLENELQKLKKESSSELSFRFSESLTCKKPEEVLFLLGSMRSKAPTLLTIYLAFNDKLKDIEEAYRLDGTASYLIEKIESSTGKAIFYDTDQTIKLVIIPVFPISRSECILGRQFSLEPLEKNFRCDKLLVLNAHAGETFAGIVEDDAFVEHEIIRSSVMGKHSKGGWSQKRFQSLVEEDVKHHADKVRAALERMVGGHKDIQYVIAGGDGKLVRVILEGYSYPLVIKSMDAISNAEQVLMEAMAMRIYGI